MKKLRAHAYSSCDISTNACRQSGTRIVAPSITFAMKLMKRRFFLPCEPSDHLRRESDSVCGTWITYSFGSTQNVKPLSRRCWMNWILFLPYLRRVAA